MSDTIQQSVKDRRRTQEKGANRHTTPDEHSSSIRAPPKTKHQNGEIINAAPLPAATHPTKNSCSCRCLLPRTTHLETDTGNITDGVTLTAETRDEDLKRQKEHGERQNQLQGVSTSNSRQKKSQAPSLLRTSSFSSTKLRQPSRGTKAVIFLPTGR